MPTIAVDSLRLSNVVKQELWPESGYCRNMVTARESSIKTYVPGTVLGRTLVSPVAAAAVAGSANTGDGVVTIDGVFSNAKVGTYNIEFITSATDAGNYVVTDPEGLFIGAGRVGVSSEFPGISISIADGAADFVVGDSFTIAVTGTYKYKISVQTATDGTQTPAVIVVDNNTIAANTDTKITVIEKGPAAVSKTGLVLDATFNTDAEKAFVYAALEAKGINCLDAI